MTNRTTGSSTSTEGIRQRFQEAGFDIESGAFTGSLPSHSTQPGCFENLFRAIDTIFRGAQTGSRYVSNPAVRNLIRFHVVGGLSTAGSLLTGMGSWPQVATGAFLNGLGNGFSTYLNFETTMDHRMNDNEARVARLESVVRIVISTMPLSTNGEVSRRNSASTHGEVSRRNSGSTHEGNEEIREGSSKEEHNH